MSKHLKFIAASCVILGCVRGCFTMAIYFGRMRDYHHGQMSVHLAKGDWRSFYRSESLARRYHKAAVSPYLPFRFHDGSDGWRDIK